MKNVIVGEQGMLHCAYCNATRFLDKRPFLHKAALGIGVLATSKKLKCVACGKYNMTGRTPRVVHKPALKNVPSRILTPDQASEQLERIRAGLKKKPPTGEAEG